MRTTIETVTVSDAVGHPIVVRNHTVTANIVIQRHNVEPFRVDLTRQQAEQLLISLDLALGDND